MGMLTLLIASISRGRLRVRPLCNSLVRSTEDKGRLTFTETASLISAMTCRRSFLFSERPWRRLPETL